MANLFSKLTEVFTGQLGRCSRCMRMAFLAAAGALVVAALATAFLPPTAAVIAGVIAAALTALWLAHVWAFTRRSVRATAIRATGGTIAQQHAALWPRRKVLAAFVRTLIFSALVSVTPRNAMAQECNCYSDNDCSCPPDFPNCIFNPSTGDAICCGPNTNGCAGPVQTWCCPPGSNCYGTEGQCYSGE
jgi:hypothetical protein